MSPISRALTNIAEALNKIADAISSTTSSKSNFSNPINVKQPAVPREPNVSVTPYLREYYDTNKFSKTVHISKAEYDILERIYSALFDKGSYPAHHESVMRELKNKWPVLHLALQDLLHFRDTQKHQIHVKKYYNYNTIFKENG